MSSTPAWPGTKPPEGLTELRKQLQLPRSRWSSTIVVSEAAMVAAPRAPTTLIVQVFEVKDSLA